jgi:ribosome-binding factor A
MKPGDSHNSPHGGPSQRQLRVGEELRHALARILNEGSSNEPELFEANITVTEVRISPDLKNATVYIMPLGGKDLTPTLAALKRAKPFFRHQVAKELRNLRNVPDLRFEADSSFDISQRINSLLRDTQQ